MKEKFTLRVEQEKLKEMKIRAIEENRPLNEVLIAAFNFYIENFEKSK